MYEVKIIRSDDAVPVGELVPHPLNPRTHPQSQVDALDAALGTVGWIDRVKVNERTRRIVNGHARYELAIARGEPTVPVDWLDLDDDAELLALVTFDPLTGLALTDDARLSALLAEVNAPAGPLADLLDAMTPVEVRRNETPDPGAQIDRAEDLREKWQTERGQLWEIGGHRLMCGDSTDAADVGRLMGGEDAPSVLLTDPPYSSGGFQESQRSAGTWGDITADNLSTRGYQALMSKVLSTVRPLCAYIFTDWRMWIPLYDTAEAASLAARAMLVWDKGSPGLGGIWRSQHELIMFASRTSSVRPKGVATMGNVLRFDRTGNDNHYTEKPVDLLAALIDNDGRMAQREDAPVIDAFAGSGSTMVAAEQLGRRCFAVEIEPKYVAVALERMAGMGLEPKLL